jgi:hypothetical protein
VSARAWAADSSLRQAAAQRLGLELELQRRLNLEHQIQTMQGALQEANEEILKITIELQKTEGELRKERTRKRPDPTSGNPNPVFRRVGLDPNAPRFVVESVRKAYRRNLHPDLQPEERKEEAEKRFKESEQVFDEIWKLRGFPTIGAGDDRDLFPSRAGTIQSAALPWVRRAFFLLVPRCARGIASKCGPALKAVIGTYFGAVTTTAEHSDLPSPR